MPDIAYNDINNSGGNFYGAGTPSGAGTITTTNNNGDPCDQFYNIFLTPNFELGTYRLQPTSPCIDAGDPSNPYDPDNTIADQGALFFMAPPVTVELTPYGTPIFIPGSGGDFTYDVELTNITDSTVVVDAWTEATLPNGSTYGPIILRNLTMASGEVVFRQMTQTVPSSAPSGYYVYKAAVGVYPALVYTFDSFNFGKLSSDATPGQGYDEWTIDGWDVSQVQMDLPIEHVLFPAYPNPFNPEAHLSFALPEAKKVSLKIYDTTGRQVATLYDGWYNAGIHEAIFSGAHLTSGIYFARLTTDGFSQTQKLMLLK